MPIYFVLRILLPIQIQLLEIENPKKSKNRLPILHSGVIRLPTFLSLQKEYNIYMCYTIQKYRKSKQIFFRSTGLYEAEFN
jgi:hypothetical protein